MDFDIVEKNAVFAIKDKAGNALKNLYIGAGWDFDGVAIDLDLVAACVSNGKVSKVIYYGDRSCLGVNLSEDNRTGEGDGDDESIVFDFSRVEQNVSSIAIGICAYAGADLSTAKNVHLRGVNGSKNTDPQVFQAPMNLASPGDTVLHAVTLTRTPGGWEVTNVNAFHKKGNGGDAIRGFANLFA